MAEEPVPYPIWHTQTECGTTGTQLTPRSPMLPPTSICGVEFLLKGSSVRCHGKVRGEASGHSITVLEFGELAVFARKNMGESFCREPKMVVSFQFSFIQTHKNGVPSNQDTLIRGTMLANGQLELRHCLSTLAMVENGHPKQLFSRKELNGSLHTGGDPNPSRKLQPASCNWEASYILSHQAVRGFPTPACNTHSGCISWDQNGAFPFGCPLSQPQKLKRVRVFLFGFPFKAT